MSEEDSVWLDIPEDLVQRMKDVVTACAFGHESMFLQAESTHIIMELDRLQNPELYLEQHFDEDED